MKDIYSIQKYYSMLKYYYDKLTEINIDTWWNINHNESEFLFKWFCIICYHFKDNLIQAWALLVEDFINKSKYLSICADICNWTKHSKWINKRSGFELNNWNSHTTINFGINWAETSNKFIIKIDWKDIDSLLFSKHCISEWEEYLNSNNIK